MQKGQKEDTSWRWGIDWSSNARLGSVILQTFWILSRISSYTTRSPAQTNALMKAWFINMQYGCRREKFSLTTTWTHFSSSRRWNFFNIVAPIHVSGKHKPRHPYIVNILELSITHADDRQKIISVVIKWKYFYF